MALRVLGVAGCPALPVEKRNAASCVPAHRYPAASDNELFAHLPLVSQPACRSWMFSHDPWTWLLRLAAIQGSFRKAEARSYDPSRYSLR